ncbi:MAG: hypothetical protein AAF998_15015 [Bacteroidota bacterium]
MNPNHALSRSRMPVYQFEHRAAKVNFRFPIRAFGTRNLRQQKMNLNHALSRSRMPVYQFERRLAEVNF